MSKEYWESESKVTNMCVIGWVWASPCLVRTGNGPPTRQHSSHHSTQCMGWVHPSCDLGWVSAQATVQHHDWTCGGALTFWDQQKCKSKIPPSYLLRAIRSAKCQKLVEDGEHRDSYAWWLEVSLGPPLWYFPVKLKMNALYDPQWTYSWDI